MDDALKLLEALSKLVQALFWPALIFYVLVRFGRSIGDFISSLGEITLKGAGFEASAKRRQNEATAALVAASVGRPDESATPEASAKAAKEAVRVVGEITNRSLRRLEGASILWVDDRPSNNVYERQSLEALGLRFTLSTSTEDALALLARQRFDLIISDMGRLPDSSAGYTLLDRLRGAGNMTPFIIYAASGAPEHRAEAVRRGAVGCTNKATELFGMVISSLHVSNPR